MVSFRKTNEASPSGKAAGFDPAIQRFESFRLRRRETLCPVVVARSRSLGDQRWSMPSLEHRLALTVELPPTKGEADKTAWAIWAIRCRRLISSSAEGILSGIEGCSAFERDPYCCLEDLW